MSSFNFSCLPRHLLLLICLVSSGHWTRPVTASLTGDSWCGTLMCVKATVNDTLVTYELKSLNQLGWMSIGFGGHMSDTPLVIMWPNANGSITLSHRQATGHVQPTPVASPPRTARISQHTNLTSQASPTLAFDIPKNNDTLQQLIWAFGVTRPPPDSDSTLEQHQDAGPFTLDLTKVLDDSGNSNAGDNGDDPATAAAPTSAIIATTTSSLPTFTPPPPQSPAQPSSSDPENKVHKSEHDSLLLAHGALSFLGFAVLLPASVLAARWGRTRTDRWLKIHWFINVVLSVPVCVVGWVLGPLSVSRRGRKHVVNEHQILGVVVFALYMLQLLLGTLIIQRRAKPSTPHPPRNIVHVVLGLSILILCFVETKTGITRDPQFSSDTVKILTALWAAWTIIIPSSYLIGLKDLRRQRDQERLGWHTPAPPIPLGLLASPVGSTPFTSRRGESASGTAASRRETSDEDDGTHDMFSRRRDSSSDPEATEMREVVRDRAIPISASTVISPSAASTSLIPQSVTFRTDMW
ncbi:hypothetical protein EIP91_010212 [Steccherinum ochraceum]|uniref:Cytochrome b561 domain-containing protein n=1 Tax=Steccherinum ochraceum TaxID=92696 RepID=A0A4R0R0W2_9APHY|nr:hypothetical protein EIP91_010212 [Steccherinum ochraceum]